MIGYKYNLQNVNYYNFKKNYSIKVTPPPKPPSRMLEAAIIITIIAIYNNRKGKCR